MKTIIAPTDFSPKSTNAVRYAADLASALGINLSIVHIYNIPIGFGEIPIAESSVREIFRDAEENMNKVKNEIVERTKGAIKVSTELIEGDIVISIMEYCNHVETYAVVMCAESRNGYERFLFGAKTLSAMKRFEWPIIVVPPDAHFESIRKIGLACDYRRVIDTVPVSEIKELVNAFHAEFHILYARGANTENFDESTVEQSEWLQEMFEGLNVKYDFIDGADVESSLVVYAEKNNLDLLIVLPKKHQIIDKIFHHSHTQRILMQANLPVMAIHE